jgi:hypothetical protein
MLAHPDRWDQDARSNFATYDSLFVEVDELYEAGPSRLVGEWPQSRLLRQTTNRRNDDCNRTCHSWRGCCVGGNPPEEVLGFVQLHAER